MQLIYYPDPILLCRCPEYDQFDKNTITKKRVLVTKMLKIMKEHNGVGLAAPQVGLNIRMFVWKDSGFGQAIWNPVLNSLSGSVKSTEGCLSLPGITVTLERAKNAILRGIGLNGRPLQFLGTPKTTRVWQHEIDHLDGKLIIDNMTEEETRANKGTLKQLIKTFGS
jgi:peptide deformylase